MLKNPFTSRAEPDVPKYIGATCGTLAGCKLRDWSAFLLALSQTNQELTQLGKQKVLPETANTASVLIICIPVCH
eukprot:7363282-Pyramimonas_sp.AAC.1